MGEFGLEFNVQVANCLEFRLQAGLTHKETPPKRRNSKHQAQAKA